MRVTERDNDEFDNRKDQPVEDSFADENAKSGSRKKTDDFDLNEKEHLGKKNRNSNSILRSLSQIFGPGVITGASDDDPSGIATYSQAGAKFGLGIIWMSLFQLPMMIVVLEMCARIGLVTGKGLAGVMKSKYPKKILYPVASLLIIVFLVDFGISISL